MYHNEQFYISVPGNYAKLASKWATRVLIDINDLISTYILCYMVYNPLLLLGL